jgi:DNA-binding NarL/FixJ family response regulator
MECRILVVCRDPLLRAGLRTVLQERLRLKGVVEVPALSEARRFNDQHLPVVLLVLGEHETDAMVGLEAFLAESHARAIVVAHSDDAAVFQASVLAGCQGYCVYTGTDIDSVLDVVRKVLNGGLAFDSIGVGHLLAGYLARYRTNGERILSPEDVQVFRCVARGAQTQEIAATLSMSEAAVKGRIARTMRRLDVSTRAAAVTKLMETGALSLGAPQVRMSGDGDQRRPLVS